MPYCYIASSFPPVQARHLRLYSLPTHKTKLTARKLGTIDISHSPQSSPETLDLRALGQLVSESQTRAIASALKALPGIIWSREVLRALHKEVDDSSEDTAIGEEPEHGSADGTGSRVKQWTTLKKALRMLDWQLDERGLDQVVEDGRLDPFLARPRKIEVGMAINRLVSAILTCAVSA